MAGINALGGGGTFLSRAYARVLVNGDEISAAARRFRDNRDENGDGVLDSEEFGANARAFARADRTGRGEVSLRDVERMLRTEATRPTQTQMVDRILENRDTDADGELTDSELSAGVPAFERIDRNGDGRVSRTELRRDLNRSIERERLLALQAGGEDAGAGVLSPLATSRSFRSVAMERLFLLGSFGDGELESVRQRHHIGGFRSSDSDDGKDVLSRRISVRV